MIFTLTPFDPVFRNRMSQCQLSLSIVRLTMVSAAMSSVATHSTSRHSPAQFISVVDPGGPVARLIHVTECRVVLSQLSFESNHDRRLVDIVSSTRSAQVACRIYVVIRVVSSTSRRCNVYYQCYLLSLPYARPVRAMLPMYCPVPVSILELCV